MYRAFFQENIKLTFEAALRHFEIVISQFFARIIARNIAIENSLASVRKTVKKFPYLVNIDGKTSTASKRRTEKNTCEQTKTETEANENTIDVCTSLA